MKVLVIGQGAREHALCWRLHQSQSVWGLYCAPGNPGINQLAEPVAIAPDNFAALIDFVREKKIDLTIVGPDNPLAEGIVDEFQRSGLTIFGPTRAAAQIESSKSFAKSVMEAAGVRTAAYRAFDDAGAARDYVRGLNRPVVVKADGLALGKGVLLCDGVDAAERALDECLRERRFGAAGTHVIVEELLSGPEVSVFGLSDGRHVRTLAPARDHKRIFDGDRGPNTGGMGSIAPPPDVDAASFNDEVARTVLQPCIDALRERGTPFVGCLYAGLMLTADGPRVLEFNARFGDPEAQVILPLLGESALALFTECARGDVGPGVAALSGGAAVGVVAAAAGYPGDVRRGDPITGIESLDPGVLCFHAGTRRDGDGTLRTSGGRVLCVTALGPDLETARTRAYGNLARVHFDGLQSRSDIGGPVTAGSRA